MNFATNTTTTVIAGGHARPIRSPTCCAAHRVPPTRFQWKTMPACESVNARKAPTAKSGIRRSVTPPKTISSTAAERRQHVHALGVHQAPSARAERARQKSIVRDGLAQARKIRERGVGRQRQHQQDGADGHVIEEPLPATAATSMDEHALISGRAGIGGGDIVDAHQLGDAGQHHDQQSDDDGQGAPRVFGGRLAKGLHAVADRFHTGHGRAATGERLQQQPGAHGCDGGGQRAAVRRRAWDARRWPAS